MVSSHLFSYSDGFETHRYVYQIHNAFLKDIGIYGYLLFSYRYSIIKFAVVELCPP